MKLKGYVSKPQVKSSGKGPFSTYTVSEKVKDPKAEKGFRKVFYNITDFSSADPPADSSYVTVEGWLKPREYTTNDGQKRLSLDVIAQSVEIAPPRDGGQVPAAATDAPETVPEDPFGDL